MCASSAPRSGYACRSAEAGLVGLKLPRVHAFVRGAAGRPRQTVLHCSRSAAARAFGGLARCFSFQIRAGSRAGVRRRLKAARPQGRQPTATQGVRGPPPKGTLGGAAARPPRASREPQSGPGPAGRAAARASGRRRRQSRARPRGGGPVRAGHVSFFKTRAPRAQQRAAAAAYAGACAARQVGSSRPRARQRAAGARTRRAAAPLTAPRRPAPCGRSIPGSAARSQTSRCCCRSRWSRSAAATC